MRNTLLCLALALCAGCNTIGPRSFSVQTFDNGRRFYVENVSGRTLHNVRMRIWVESGILYDCGKRKIEEMTPNDGFDFPATFNYGVSVVAINGRAKEGTFHKEFNCRPPAVIVH